MRPYEICFNIIYAQNFNYELPYNVEVANRKNPKDGLSSLVTLSCNLNT